MLDEKTMLQEVENAVIDLHQKIDQLGAAAQEMNAQRGRPHEGSLTELYKQARVKYEAAFHQAVSTGASALIFGYDIKDAIARGEHSYRLRKLASDHERALRAESAVKEATANIQTLQERFLAELAKGLVKVEVVVKDNRQPPDVRKPEIESDMHLAMETRVLKDCLGKPYAQRVYVTLIKDGKPALGVKPVCIAYPLHTVLERKI